MNWSCSFQFKGCKTCIVQACCTEMCQDYLEAKDQHEFLRNIVNRVNDFYSYSKERKRIQEIFRNEKEI